MKRDATRASTLPDPVREAAGLPIGNEGGYFVGSTDDYGQVDDISVVNHNQPPMGQPGLWCQWVPSDDGECIEWDGGEKFYSYIEWLQYLIKHFLAPWGYVLNGEVRWRGEDFEDIGIIGVFDNKVKIGREPTSIQWMDA